MNFQDSPISKENAGFQWKTAWGIQNLQIRGQYTAQVIEQEGLHSRPCVQYQYFLVQLHFEAFRGRNMSRSTGAASCSTLDEGLKVTAPEQMPDSLDEQIRVPRMDLALKIFEWDVEKCHTLIDKCFTVKAIIFSNSPC